MNLFALTTIAGARILRFPLTQQLQNKIATAFSEQLQAFEQGVQQTVPFDGRYTPDKDELLIISDFVDVDGVHQAINNPLAISPFSPDSHSLETVKALFTSVADESGTKVLIQLFEQRRLVSAKKGVVMFFSDDTFSQMTDTGLVLDRRLLAVLEGTSIRFQSFHFLSRVFDLSDHFNEATQEEVQAFANHEKLAVDDISGFGAGAGQFVRKKIALILQSGVLDKYSGQDIANAAQAFNVEIELSDDGKIKLPTNDKGNLRRLLRFLDEDYYEATLSQTRFLANSKRVAD